MDDKLDMLVQEEGSGCPVVFLHGLGLDRHQWAQEMRFFQNRRPAAAPSLPGQGESSSRWPLTLTSMAEAVWTALDPLGWSKVHLIGCSMGGLTAWEMHRQQPTRTQSLVTFGSAPRLTVPRWVIQPSSWLLDRWLAGRNPTKYAELAAKGASRIPEVKKRLSRAFERAARNWHPALYPLRCAIAHYDYLPLLQTVNCPTAVIRAEYDTAINKRIDRLQPKLAANKQVHVVRLDRAGHVANWDQPEAFLAQITHWMNEVDARK